uniref:Uncharacterized protein n=1 Tax=Oryza glumipatula TaxID=40148 RepID=A0A0E0AC84_9ORYZ
MATVVDDADGEPISAGGPRDLRPSLFKGQATANEEIVGGTVKANSQKIYFGDRILVQNIKN